ncbi:MAG TPA: polyprenyl synthetase family protein [Nitrococcus sp.]|nr:polyprenyl synthetase family protein [Nitrococcus sp.]
MDFIDYWTKIRLRLDDDLTRQIPKLFPTLELKQTETVQHIIKDGKRIRGCLVCLVSQALGGKIAGALPRAVAIECIQAASLIHDDYVDNDVIRRKRPATWTVEGPRRAVLLGDVIFATAIRSMVELSSEDGIAVTRAIATVANGAYQELTWLMQSRGGRDGNRLEGNIYERIIYLKTGALFGAACQLGALAAGASRETCALAYAFGARTGEAYQIADDLADFSAPFRLRQLRNEKLPALLPALNYFSHKVGLTTPNCFTDQQHGLYDWCQRIGEDFIRHMEHEINQRVRLAESYIEQLSSNSYGKILGEAPTKIVASMMSQAAMQDI